jgi:glycosyltransferase involved in cell wall biosynthesis
MSATSDINKGFKELSEALNRLIDNNIELIVVGSNKPKQSQEFPFKVHYLGFLHDDISLVTLYSAADVIVVPSLQENLSNVIMEGLACGIPIVAFNIGGNSDMISHKVNWYLAQPFKSDDLAYGIEWVLHAPNYEALSKNARDKVVREFDSIVVAKKYVELYKEILNEKGLLATNAK